MKSAGIILVMFLLGACTDLGSAPGGTCGAPPSSCITCLQKYCSSEASACLGSDFENSDDGACKGLYACECSCQGSDCHEKCASMIGSSCVSCMSTLNTCIQSNCESACSDQHDMSASMGGDGGGPPSDGSVPPNDGNIPSDDGSVPPGDGGGMMQPGDGGGTSCSSWPTSSCKTCLSNSCDNLMAACLGSKWQTVDDGVCKGMYKCICDCQKNAGTDCQNNCAKFVGLGCQTCWMAASSCVENTCAQMCK